MADCKRSDLSVVKSSGFDSRAFPPSMCNFVANFLFLRLPSTQYSDNEQPCKDAIGLAEESDLVRKEIGEH